MKTQNRNRWAFFALAGLLVLPVHASQAACTLSASGLIFDNYSPFSASPEDSVGEIVVECEEATAYTLVLEPGNGTYQDRYLSGPEDQLYYNLFVDVNRITVWGDGSGDTAVESGNQQYEAHSVYGRIFSGQNVRPGSYQDSIVVRVEY
ncbi:spore coat protein U-like protein [Natronospira proteinivora]|uniref:Spore coat protein U-like protein n=1 Tax=Natronospira proteinivora TaxID=1807133 RepID=A0ABT1G7F9_9GAMM|nr:spore coat U domain-containing protein [Natronospira proteinivora]MCP1727232.1 spore coat protein U-like protein [Natronospira proteinivora]